MFVAQFCHPVIELTLTLARLQPLTLPHAVVQVLHGQRGQRRLAIIQKGFVQFGQFAGEDVHRPPFGDDVVQGQYKVMLMLARLDHAGAQQRPTLKIKWLVRFVIGQRVQALLTDLLVEAAQVQPGHVHTGLGLDGLTGHAVHTRKGGAQGFMAQQQGLQGRLEAPDIQQAFEARHATDVVGRAVGFHFPEKPHALLGVGQGHRLATVNEADRLLGIALPRRLNLRDLSDKRAQFAGFKQRAQPQLHVTGLTHSGDDLRGQQGVPAQGKEVIAQADFRLPQHVAPNRGDLLLKLGGRRHKLADLPLRLGQGAAIQFATRAQRHRLQTQ